MVERERPTCRAPARLERLRTGYKEKRANVIEVAQVISGVLDEVARATSMGTAG